MRCSYVAREGADRLISDDLRLGGTGRRAGLTTPADSELVAGCRRGEAEAWNLLVERFSRYVYAISSQGFRLSSQDAEDVFQDVFTKIFEQLGTLRDDSAVRPWIAQLTRRTCIDRLRSLSRETPAEDADGRAFDEAVARLDEALDVRGGLEQLSGDCRDILDRFFARDESYRTIGAALELPAGTIASRISRCLEKLKGVLEDSGVADRHVAG